MDYMLDPFGQIQILVAGTCCYLVAWITEILLLKVVFIPFTAVTFTTGNHEPTLEYHSGKLIYVTKVRHILGISIDFVTY